MAKKVLVIEDTDELLELVREGLAAAGFEVHTFATGRQAWDEIVSVMPDLLIVDLLLPQFDGYTLALKMGADPRTSKIPILAMTSLAASKELFEKVPQVAGFFAKPFKIEDLVKAARAAAR